MAHRFPDKTEFRNQFHAILNPESGFYKVVLIYSFAISLLTLAVPISLQLLVDTVANIALVRAVGLIALLLFVLLFLSGVMYALRAYAMELFSRKLYARISSEIALTAMLSESHYFERNHESDLFNRYFDILTLKKNIPTILTNGFTLILQMIIGFIVVSFYHFYFFIFSIGLVLLIWLVWIIWGWRSINTSFRLSEAKYQTAAWLQSLAVYNEAYWSSHHPSYVLEETDRLIDAHIKCQSNHFHHTYAQLISMLLLYAVASATLLGLGGWLVLQGQLTLGQLVAAELIMSAIFFGLPQLAGYLDSYYDVCASIEELARFQNVATEVPEKNTDMPMPDNSTVVFSKVKFSNFNKEIEFNLELPAGGLYKVTGNIMCLRHFGELLRRDYRPDSGLITIGGYDNCEIQRPQLRHAVRMINRITLPPITVRDFLSLFVKPEGKYSRQQALAMLELDDAIGHLKDGMDTMLSRGAWPLSQPQAIRLKLASALLSEPEILILEDIVDVVDRDIINTFLKAMQELGSIVLYYTQRQDITGFNNILELESNRQTVRIVTKD